MLMVASAGAGALIGNAFLATVCEFASWYERHKNRGGPLPVFPALGPSADAMSVGVLTIRDAVAALY